MGLVIPDNSTGQEIRVHWWADLSDFNRGQLEVGGIRRFGCPLCSDTGLVMYVAHDIPKDPYDGWIRSIPCTCRIGMGRYLSGRGGHIFSFLERSGD